MRSDGGFGGVFVALAGEAKSFAGGTSIVSSSPGLTPSGTVMLKLRPSNSTVNSMPGKQPSGTVTSTRFGGAVLSAAGAPVGSGTSRSISLPGPQPSGHVTVSCWPSYSMMNSCPSYTPSGTVTATIVVMPTANPAGKAPHSGVS